MDFVNVGFGPIIQTYFPKQILPSQISTNREVFQDISNITSVQTSDTVAAQTADNSATFSRDIIDDSLPGCSHCSPRIVYQESAPHQTKDQPNTSQAEQNQSNEQTQSLELAENPVCQEPETSQLKWPDAVKATVALFWLLQNNSFHFRLLKNPFVLLKSVGKQQLSRRLPTNKN